MFVAAKCPACAGALQIPTERNTIKCMYCGIELVVKQLLGSQEAQVQIENLMQLAKNSENGKNNAEAYKYYSQILEIDSSNVEAWLGRANATTWLSTIGHPRIAESIEDIKTAQKLGINDSIIKPFAFKFFEACGNVYLGFNKYLTQDRDSSDLKRPSVWETYSLGALWCIEGMQMAHQLSPDDEEIQDMTISVVNGVIKWCKHGNNYLIGVQESNRAKEKLVGLHAFSTKVFSDLISIKIKNNPNYKVPSLEIEPTPGTRSGCIVPMAFFVGSGLFLKWLI